MAEIRILKSSSARVIKYWLVEWSFPDLVLPIREYTYSFFCSYQNANHIARSKCVYKCALYVHVLWVRMTACVVAFLIFFILLLLLFTIYLLKLLISLLHKKPERKLAYCYCFLFSCYCYCFLSCCCSDCIVFSCWLFLSLSLKTRLCGKFNQLLLLIDSA